MTDDECPVCLEALASNLRVTLPCSTGSSLHTVCMRCFIHLCHRACPLCRASFEHAIPEIEDGTRMNLIEFLRAPSDRG
jgi:hypothetical protein